MDASLCMKQSRLLCCAAAYYATYVLAFILVGVYLGYAVLILVMRNVFVREEKEGKYAAPVTPAPAPVATTPYSQVRLLFLVQNLAETIYHSDDYLS